MAEKKCIVCKKIKKETDFYSFHLKTYYYCCRGCYLQGLRDKYIKHPPRGRIIDSGGYVKILCRNHPRRNSGSYVGEHILIAEKALNHYLPETAVVHHHNEIKSDNSSGNLVVCENKSYHHILHSRIKSRKMCGNANYSRCWYCKKYDSKENLKKGSLSYIHKECDSSYRKHLKGGK